MTFLSPQNRKRPAGFTLLEALLLVSILGIVGAGIGSALMAMTRSPSQINTAMAVEATLLDKMEYLRSLPFPTLAADVPRGTSLYTDTVTIDGVSVPRTVKIVYVVPATTAVSPVATHMLQISVTTDVRSFVCLVNEP